MHHSIATISSFTVSAVITTAELYTCTRIFFADSLLLYI